MDTLKKYISFERAAIIILLFGFCWLWWSKKEDDGIDYSGAIKEFKEKQEVIDSAVSEIKRLDAEFDSINSRLNKRYANIDTINDSSSGRLYLDDFLLRSGYISGRK